MENIQEPPKVAGSRKGAKAAQNSTVSKDGMWRTFPEVPCLMQRKTGTFYIRKRIDGVVYCRSLDTEVFSVARERMPNKLKEILIEIANPGKPDAIKSPDATSGANAKIPAKPVTAGDGISKHMTRLEAGPFKKQTHR